MSIIKESEREGTIVETILGRAIYSHTEVEDDDGNWNDSWSTTNGEYVIHEYELHHVYIVR